MPETPSVIVAAVITQADTCRNHLGHLRKEKRDFFDQFGAEAKAILTGLLEKYTEHGTAQFVVPDVLKVPPISDHGNIMQIIQLLGGADKLRAAVNQLQKLLYAAWKI